MAGTLRTVFQIKYDCWLQQNHLVVYHHSLYVTFIYLAIYVYVINCGQY